MTPTACTPTAGIVPGLGFQHLGGDDATSSGARGRPTAKSANDASSCCAQCDAASACSAWAFKANASGGLCYLGNCGGRPPCFERVSKSARVAGGVNGRGQSAGAVECAPPASAAPRVRPARGRTSDDGAPAQAGPVALLLLGHRARLTFSTVPSRVVAPIVAQGHRAIFFALLENSTVAQAFRGRRPQGHPSLAPLSDAALAEELRARVRGAGGEIGRMHIGPRPTAQVPPAALDAGRLWRYKPAVKRTVAVRLLKEKLGLQLVLDHEREAALQFQWVLWHREDAHWFAPIDLRRFAGATDGAHSKACGGFGGWNDKAWLLGRAAAERALSMYDDFHAPAPSRCKPLPGAAGATAEEVDFLQAPSVEQFRARVGLLRGIPMRRWEPEALPVMDSYYAEGNSTADGAAEDAALVPAPGWQLCFPRIYSRGCVPRASASFVARFSCA